ncbi:helix-turn-helix domain-containing protein [Nocardia asteroides]|uniref:helix-turn-helix domain-containing protein n=1 Tax=Nocardia asteroides TaxID=1824 RepID=UPI00364F75C4
MPNDTKPALNPTTREFGARVRDRRMAIGLSQETAAVRCGIHWTQLGKVERGQRSLRLETIMKIADWLDIDAGVLVSESPQRRAARADDQFAYVQPPRRRYRLIIRALDISSQFLNFRQ